MNNVFFADFYSIIVFGNECMAVLLITALLLLLANSGAHPTFIDGLQYLGCYADTYFTRTLNGYNEKFQNANNILPCVELCRTQGYIYAGLELHDCFCGNDNYARNGKSFTCYDFNHLTKPLRRCADNVNVCGGAWTLSIYRVCPYYTYGAECQHTCDCGHHDCNIGGTCLNHCLPGWTDVENGCNTPCSSGTYGPGCGFLCGGNCKDNKCDPDVGSCSVGCDAGEGPFCYTGANAGPLCQAAHNPLAGPCPFCGHCTNSTCYGEGEECMYKCHSGWQGGQCISCNTGTWGDYCENDCSAFCDEQGCNMQNGFCNGGCLAVYYGNSCDQVCGHCKSGNCNKSDGDCGECETGYFGAGCKYRCGQCASDLCDKLDASCDTCLPGYYGSDCVLSCGHCASGSCEKVNGSCGACLSGYYGSGCDLQCGHTSSGSCEKTDGSSGACLPGYYGSSCELTCGQCDLVSCHQTHGTCSVCKAGYHDSQCRSECSEHCMTNTCNQMSGHCDEGCEQGYFPPLCNEQCPERCVEGCDRINGSCIAGCVAGFHGAYCEHSCPEHCKDNTCEDGKCNAGCQPGYAGEACDMALCPNCMNDNCDEDGACVDGCNPGWLGDNCIVECSDKTYGLDCASLCHCHDDKACDKSSGTCPGPCADNWSGGSCSVYAAPLVGSPTNIIVIAVSVVVVLLTIISASAVTYYFLRRKVDDPNVGRVNENTLDSIEQSTDDEQVEAVHDMDEGQVEDDDVDNQEELMEHLRPHYSSKGFHTPVT